MLIIDNYLRYSNRLLVHVINNEFFTDQRKRCDTPEHSQFFFTLSLLRSIFSTEEKYKNNSFVAFILIVWSYSVVVQL